MRVWAVLFWALLTTQFAPSQGPNAKAGPGPETGKIDVSIVVSKHPTGADMVEITVLSPDYPASELAKRATEIGTELGTPVRGLQIFSESNGSQATASSPFLKATFATNGILAGAAGIKLQPMVRAFAGGVGPSAVQGLDIHLEGVSASATTLPSFDSASVSVWGSTEPSPPALDYRVQIKSQTPESIVIPDKLDVSATKEQAAAPQSAAPTWLIWSLVVLGALAAGALVYNLALRGSSRTQRG